jgi:hypothetical protein
VNNYERILTPYRTQLAKFIDDNYMTLEAPRAMEALQKYTRLGYEMTKDVVHWLTCAGDTCFDFGVANFLVARAEEEEGHEKLMTRDADKLGAAGNFSLAPGVRQYERLHWEAIKESWGAIVPIMYEIEMLSITHGPRILDHVKKVLGEDVVNSLSFLQSHVNFDVTHTKENRECMEMMLKDDPSKLPHLVEYGVRALSAYQLFLQDCLNEATQGVAISSAGRELHVQSSQAGEIEGSGNGI